LAFAPRRFALLELGTHGRAALGLRTFQTCIGMLGEHKRLRDLACTSARSNSAQDYSDASGRGAEALTTKEERARSPAGRPVRDSDRKTEFERQMSHLRTFKLIEQIPAGCREIQVRVS